MTGNLLVAAEFLEVVQEMGLALLLFKLGRDLAK